MARTELFPIKFMFGISHEMDEAISAWRREQPDLPNRSEAIRRLIQIGLRTAAETVVPGVGSEPSREKPRSEAGSDTRDTISFGGQNQRVGEHPDQAARRARVKAQKRPHGKG
jgi:hypothetical protein